MAQGKHYFVLLFLKELPFCSAVGWEIHGGFCCHRLQERASDLATGSVCPARSLSRVLGVICKMLEQIWVVCSVISRSKLDHQSLARTSITERGPAGPPPQHGDRPALPKSR